MPPGATSMIRAARTLAALAVLAALGGRAGAQLNVYPRRPGPTPNVHYQDFHWRYVDILRGNKAARSPEWNPGRRAHSTAYWHSPRPDAPLRAWTDPMPLALAGAAPGAAPVVDAKATKAKSGGIRLYFYESERDTAERAAASIVATYHKLSQRFRYTPNRTVPYFLYDSYVEFLQTNLFAVEEGVLGVTSSRGLEMSLPYFGDHRFFEEVSTHEFSHQFTFQKEAQIAAAAKAQSDPLDHFPLWFVEGLAEYYAHDGLDAESEAMIRDLILDPDPKGGYVFTDFFSDDYGYITTYKLGQARCTFLQDTYGKWFIQRMLEEAPLMVEVNGRKETIDFKQLLTKLTGDPPQRIHERFVSWLKQRGYTTWLASRHRPDTLRPVEGGPEDAFALGSSPDGTLLMVRTVNLRTRQFVLSLFDPRSAGSGKTIAADAERGVESLHPVSARNFSVGQGILAWVAQRQGHDVIYWNTYSHSAQRGGIVRADRFTRKATKVKGWRVKLSVSKRHKLDLQASGLSVIESIALSPDDKQIAVVGTARRGRRDVWVVELATSRLTRITDDWFSEREVSWGPAGLLYTSDSTGHGMYDLFQVADPSRPQPVIERLTSGGRDALDPHAAADGRILFVAHDDSGANVYEVLEPGLVVRRTQASTALYDVAAAPDGQLWALHLYQGRRVPVLIERRTLMSEPAPGPAVDPVPAIEPGRLAIKGDQPYEASSLSNWQLLSAFANIGVGNDYRGNTLILGAAAIVAADRLRNHVVGLFGQALGTLGTTEVDLFYSNQEHRLQWQVDLFQEPRWRYDYTFDRLGMSLGGPILSVDRFFGARFEARYPFDQFLHVQAGVAAGGVDFLLDSYWRDLLELTVLPSGEIARDVWESANAGVRPRVEGGAEIGYTNLRGHPFTGPIAGSSAMLEVLGTADPTVPTGWGSVRLDAEHYIPLIGRSNIAMRMSAAQMDGGRNTPGYFLYAPYTLRGVPLNDERLLFGKAYGFGIMELQFPLDALVHLFIFDLEGILGVDFGGVGSDPKDAWQNRVLDFAVGVNLALGPLELRWHYANPVDVGGRILPNNGDWVTNVSLGYRYQ
ncbi:MAG TPA: hypothetical protein VL172_19835 [Kofleriaceae bacterium]|nr:hypothetical protein [Kofleriaceae bacterium]